MSKWISVKDELPEKSLHNYFSKSVLGYCEIAKSQYSVIYNHKSKIFHHFPNGGYDIVYGRITHWMPLPEPPGDS